MIDFNSKNARVWSRLGPSGAISDAALELCRLSDKNIFLTADLSFFSGLDVVKNQHPDRLYNFGIAEQNMLGAAAGFAKEGFVPFVSTYASFACSRCLDQVRVNMSYMKFPIKLLGLTSGYGAGILGATHMCIEDLAIMRTLPNIVVLSPCDCFEIVKSIISASQIATPVYIRLTGPISTPIINKNDYDFRIGKAITLQKGQDVCFIATGAILNEVLAASEILINAGISSEIINMHTVKPLDVETLDDVTSRHKLVVTVEEHSVYGGLGSSICEYISSLKRNVKVEILGINDIFVKPGDYQYQLEQSLLDRNNIVKRVKKLLQIQNVKNYC